MKFSKIIFLPCIVLVSTLILLPKIHLISSERVQKNSTFTPTVEEVARVHNISLMRNALKKGEYRGYDVILVSSTSQQEADYQQLNLEKLFEGTLTSKGFQPIILSVVDFTEGGQLIGSVYTWLKAEEKMRETHPELLKEYATLIDFIQANGLKVAAFHNGGKGERCSPLTQSLGNSRGAQKLVGTVQNALNEKIDLDIIIAAVLQCSSFALTNQGTHLDTFWTSQIAFGSHPHDQLVRSNHQLDKFLVGFDQDQMDAQNIADFGTAALSKQGRMTVFYGNKRFASRKGNEYVIDKDKMESELLSKGDRVAYDFGSFTLNYEMWKLLLDFWQKKIDFSSTPSKLKRDIDPHFIQPFIRLLYGLNDLAERKMIDAILPAPSSLTQDKLDEVREAFDNHLKLMMPEVHAYIWQDVNQETDAKKRLEAHACMQEAMEFYILYHPTAPLKDLHKLFGFIDLGDQTQWFRYRRPIDIMNEKFEMLTDLIDKKIEAQLDGSIHFKEVNLPLLRRSFEARLMRGITDDQIAQFKVNGKWVTMSAEEVRKGKTIDDVYIKNSIIQNCELFPGSSVVNSVLNHVHGKVLANNSYLESSTCPVIEANNSILHHVIDHELIKGESEVVSDVFKTKLDPPYHGRMRAPLGYDPKGMPIYKNVKEGTSAASEEFDETIRYFVQRLPYELKGMKEFSDWSARTEDGRFSFEEIREIEPLRIEDKNFCDFLHHSTKKSMMEVFSRK